MSICNFIATDVKLSVFNNDEDNTRSFNELLKVGYSESELYKLFGGIIKGLDVDKDKKFFLLDDDSNENKLVFCEDSNNKFTRYYSKKKNVYVIENGNNNSLPIAVMNFLNTINVPYKNIELWHTWLDVYELEEVDYEESDFSKLTVDKLESFFDNYTYLNPKVMLIYNS